MPSIIMDVSASNGIGGGVDRIMSRVDSSIVPRQVRKAVTFSFTFDSAGRPATMTVNAPSTTVLDQVANLVRRLKLLGNRVADRAQVTLTTIPTEVSAFQGYI